MEKGQLIAYLTTADRPQLEEYAVHIGYAIPARTATDALRAHLVAAANNIAGHMATPTGFIPTLATPTAPIPTTNGGNVNNNTDRNARFVLAGTVLGALAVAMIMLFGFIWAVKQIGGNGDKSTASASSAAGSGSSTTGNGSSANGGNTGNSGNSGGSGNNGNTGNTGNNGNSGGSGSTNAGLSIDLGGKNAPNMDSVTWNGCDGTPQGPNGVYIASGETNTCTATVGNIPSDWQMTVDAQDYTFRGVLHTNKLQAYENLGGSVTITIHNGAILIGTPEFARQRFCKMADIGGKLNFAYFQSNALSSWAPCPGMTASNAGSGSGSASSTGGSSTSWVDTGPLQVADFPTGATVSGSVVCVGGSFVLNGDTPLPGPDGPNQPGCTGTRRNEVNTPEVFASAGQVWNGRYKKAA